MKLNNMLIIILGIVVISIAKVVTEDINFNNMFYNILVKSIFWLCLFIFMDWRDWVKGKT